MTNEQLKQKAIQEAYGEYWDEVKDFVNASGWFVPWAGSLTGKSEKFLDFLGNCDDLGNSFRPKQLRGLNDNNGWVRIYEDGSNFPVKGKYIGGNLIGSDFYETDKMSAEEVREYFTSCQITHYRPVLEYPKPVY